MSVFKVTTESGAIYLVDTDTGKVTGGSKSLKDGRLPKVKMQLQIGRSMLIDTPERREQNLGAVKPGIVSTPIVSIEEIEVELVVR